MLFPQKSITWVVIVSMCTVLAMPSLSFAQDGPLINPPGTIIQFPGMERTTLGNLCKNYTTQAAKLTNELLLAKPGSPKNAVLNSALKDLEAQAAKCKAGNIPEGWRRTFPPKPPMIEPVKTPCGSGAGVAAGATAAEVEGASAARVLLWGVGVTVANALLMVLSMTNTAGAGSELGGSQSCIVNPEFKGKIPENVQAIIRSAAEYNDGNLPRTPFMKAPYGIAPPPCVNPCSGTPCVVKKQNVGFHKDSSGSVKTYDGHLPSHDKVLFHEQGPVGWWGLGNASEDWYSCECGN